MNEELGIWERARLARDARFDGRFFVGVTTTGIYCRPICPVQSPKATNVRYFSSAAAAEEAGFRPCLRCRPEASPGTPAWFGSSATVSRALKLIAGGALDAGSVDQLAGRLGVGGRQLRRLFLKHLGATPVAVAQTRRLHFAKKLIDETALPMAQVAFASGFGSIRRFNATFQSLYRRSPSELRRIGLHGGESCAQNEYSFRLSFRPPYDWEALLAFLRPRAIPGVETVTAQEYRRTIAIDGKAGFLQARLCNNIPCLELDVHFPDPGPLFLILERVRRMFDLGADPQEISRHLGGDPWLADPVARRPGLRVPGTWDGFEFAVRAVLGQQVTVRGATTTTAKLAEAFGTRCPFGILFPTPQALADADYRCIGLTDARVRTLRALAQAVLRGWISFDGSCHLESFLARFMEIPGIGPWTAHYVAMRALGEPDALPANDLALLRAASARGGPMTARMLEARSSDWRPWRAYAAMHLWMTTADAGRSEARKGTKSHNHAGRRRVGK